MDLPARNQPLDLVVHSTSVGNIKDMIKQIKDIKDPAEQYKSQQAVLEQLLDAYDNIDNTIKKFYL